MCRGIGCERDPLERLNACVIESKRCFVRLPFGRGVERLIWVNVAIKGDQGEDTLAYIAVYSVSFGIGEIALVLVVVSVFEETMKECRHDAIATSRRE